MVAEFLYAKLTMYTTNVIANGVLLGVLFARVKEISFKRRANYMKLACVKEIKVNSCTQRFPSLLNDTITDQYTHLTKI